MTTIKNPFDTAESRAQSNYGRWDGEQLVITPDGTHNSMTTDVHAALRAMLHDPDFPCVGAKSVVNQSSYRFGLYDLIASPGATAGLAYDLYRFGEERPHIEADFTSFIASFMEPKVRSMKAFEALLWRQLEALHELDRRYFEWNSQVSSDPEDAGFSFSFAGGAYFVVGLSPANRRWARRFAWPTLVFNDHFQFERLREENRFNRIRDAIRERDTDLHGSASPMLDDYGAHSEARQYSGRHVGGDWRCPVHFD
jgi:hypothetical protein